MLVAFMFPVPITCDGDYGITTVSPRFLVYMMPSLDNAKRQRHAVAEYLSQHKVPGGDGVTLDFPEKDCNPQAQLLLEACLLTALSTPLRLAGCSVICFTLLARNLEVGSHACC